MRLLAAAVAASLLGCRVASRVNEVPPQVPPAAYFSDLGPDTIDVSSYPARKQAQYQVFASVCSRCHALARTINSPAVSRDFWTMYILAMQKRSYYAPIQEISSADAVAIVDFLDYDTQQRKLGAKQKEFEEATEALRKRFEETIKRR